MSTVILGKNIQLPILMGIIKRHYEEKVSTIFCTPSQLELLFSLGLSKEIRFQLMGNLEHLNEYLDDREINDIADRIKSFSGSQQVFLVGEINHIWLIGAVKSGSHLSSWNKESAVQMEDLCAFAQVSKKEVLERKRIGNDEQFFFRNSSKCNIARFFPKTQVAVVEALDFPWAMNFLALGLKERLIRHVLVVCKGDVPGFAEEWVRCLPSTLSSGGGFGSIRLGEDGFEETWTKEVFSRIQVISKNELNNALGIAE